MADCGPAVLVFPDRKQEGRFPVRDGGGEPVAHISVRWTGAAFTATDVAWKRDFTVSGADGTAVVTVVPQTSALSLRPHDYAVQQGRPVFRTGRAGRPGADLADGAEGGRRGRRGRRLA